MMNHQDTISWLARANDHYDPVVLISWANVMEPMKQGLQECLRLIHGHSTPIGSHWEWLWPATLRGYMSSQEEMMYASH